MRFCFWILNSSLIVKFVVLRMLFREVAHLVPVDIVAIFRGRAHARWQEHLFFVSAFLTLSSIKLTAIIVFT